MIWLVPANGDRERKFIVVVISECDNNDGPSDDTPPDTQIKYVRYPSVSKNNTMPLFYIVVNKCNVWYAANAIFVNNKYGFIVQ